MKRKIIVTSNPVEEKILRSVAVPVPAGEIGTTKVQSLIRDLKDTLDSTDVGIAIAAPQIGESVRIFVVSPKAFGEGASHLVCINPELTRLSRDKRDLNEGCLSIPEIMGTVRRSVKATLRAYDEHGNKFERGASGLLAQIFQHEYDHLDGILFTDRAKDIRPFEGEDNEEAAV
jgi:peptide deformylase